MPILRPCDTFHSILGLFAKHELDNPAVRSEEQWIGIGMRSGYGATQLSAAGASNYSPADALSTVIVPTFTTRQSSLHLTVEHRSTASGAIEVSRYQAM